MIVVFTTTSTLQEAERIAGLLVDNSLAACVQILPPITSVYVWQGEVRQEPEHLLLIKTLAARYGEVEALIRENHSYEVPEIVSVAATDVSAPYLEWLTAAVSK